MSYATPTQSCLIYDLFEPSTGVWQYVVADPQTHRCLVIDPILESTQGTNTYGTVGADTILGLIRSHGYKVDRLLATHASNGRRTAVWYLRMQLLQTQGFAPKLGGGELVSRLTERFERKYGPHNGFSTTVGDDLEDGAIYSTGSLQIRAIHLPGLAPSDFGYLVGSNLFGALSICRAAQLVTNVSGWSPDMENYLLLTSLDKLASLPESCRLLPDQGQQYDPVRTPYATLAEFL